VDIDSFQRVTGPKQDLWLVKTVGALVAVIGASLIVAGRRRTNPTDVAILAAGSALALATIDVTYVRKGRISPIYLADAAAEYVLLAALTTEVWDS
jgi:drug/metabolite transporter (DMT)-like permease